MPSIGPMELGIILVIVVLIFGVGKLPELGGALGKSIKEFRKSTAELTAAASGTAIGEGHPVSAGTTPAAHSLQPGAVTPSVCPQCSSANSPGNTFCGSCGARMV